MKKEGKKGENCQKPLDNTTIKEYNRSRERKG
jgi:hypothetical protein